MATISTRILFSIFARNEISLQGVRTPSLLAVLSRIAHSERAGATAASLELNWPVCLQWRTAALTLAQRSAHCRVGSVRAQRVAQSAASDPTRISGVHYGN